MPRLSLLFLLFNLAVLPIYASSSEYDVHKPVGWGSVESVTGKRVYSYEKSGIYIRNGRKVIMR